jgi:hypothetical protein
VSPARRTLLFRVARFFFAFGLMVAPWPGLGAAFADTIGAAATAAADPFFSSSNVTLTVRAPRPAENQPDWRGIIDVKQDFPEGTVRHAGAIDLRRAGYLQLATFIALAAAWVPEGRRRILEGACVIVVVVSAIVAIPIVDFLAQAGVAHLGASLSTLIALARRALLGAPGMAYAVPGIAWLALSRV